MAVNLNLLPQDLRVSKGINNVIRLTRSINVILVVIFIVSIIGAGAFLIISSIRLNSIQSEITKLEQQVKAQETSEQQLVLLKDRISKISTARSYLNATKNIENINSVLTNTLSAVKIDSLSITPSKTDISLTLLSNEDLKTYLKNLKESGKFKSVDLYSFDYNKNIGYLVKVVLINK